MQHPCQFKDLPPVQGMPAGCAWNYFTTDKEHRDELGTLNLLTPEVVKRAARTQIQTGIRVQLDWGMNNVQFPGFGRQGFEQKIISRTNTKTGWVGCDDVISFNTQCSSQWDGFRHVAHQVTKKFYNNQTQTDIADGKGSMKGIDAWCDAGGIAGRGVLLDWLRWRRMTQPDATEISPVTSHKIPLGELQQVAAYQGVQFEIGDILLVRTGFVEWHNNASLDQRKAGTQENATYIGVEANMEAVEWFWNHHFAAVVSDTVAFESWPPVGSAAGGVCLHEWFLAMWGTPIGEMWDLELLSKLCEKQQRWTFFLTSAPLRYPGGVGSTPNAIAIM